LKKGTAEKKCQGENNENTRLKSKKLKAKSIPNRPPIPETTQIMTQNQYPSAAQLKIMG